MRQLGPKPWSLANEPGSDTPLQMMDVWNFEYFRVVYAKEFSLFLGTSVWETLVLRAALTERCILNAVLALGALSRNAVPSSVRKKPALPPEFPIRYSLTKYNQAIQELNGRLAASPSSWELAVLGSLIFIVVESIQGNYDVAQMHLRGALAILKSCELSSDGSPQPRADLAHVLNAFSRLHGQSLGLQEHYIHTSLRFPVLPPAFGNISEARSFINSITGAINSLFWKGATQNDGLLQLPSNPALERDLSILLGLLDSWNALFSRFINCHVMDTKTESCIKILLIHHRVARISALVYFNSSELAYDAYTSDFSTIVDLATKIIAAEQNPSTSRTQSSPNFTFDITLVQPLFFVACKCRDSTLRRYAIDVMENIRGQSFCDIRLLTRVARRVVTLEESQGSTSGMSPCIIEEQDRLRDIELDFNIAATCTIRAWKRLDGGELSEVIAHLHMSSP